MSYVNTISHFPRHTGIKNLSTSRHPYLFSTPPPFAVLTGIIFPSDLSSISPPLRLSTGGLSHSLCHPGVMVHSPFLPWHAPVEKVIWSPLRVRAAAPAIKQHIINHICAPRLWSRMLRHTEMNSAGFPSDQEWFAAITESSWTQLWHAGMWRHFCRISTGL